MLDALKGSWRNVRRRLLGEDPRWTEAREFLKANAGEDDVAVVPDDFGDPGCRAVAYAKFREDTPFTTFTLHKGLIDTFSLNLLERLLEEREVSFANPVFVVFGAGGGAGDAAPTHVAPLLDLVDEWRETASRHQNRIAFIHIPKTGGTSVFSWLSTFYPRRIYFPRNVDLESFGRSLSEYDLVSGHVRADTLLHRLEDERLWIVFLRDPVRRFLSAVAHSRREAEDPATFGPRMKMMRQSGLEEFIHSELGFSEIHSQLFMLGVDPEKPTVAQSPEECYERARAFIDREEIFAGVTERMAESTQLLAERLGLPEREVERRNVTTGYSSLVSDSEKDGVMEELRAMLEWDIRLHRDAEQMLADRLASR